MSFPRGAHSLVESVQRQSCSIQRELWLLKGRPLPLQEEEGPTMIIDAGRELTNTIQNTRAGVLNGAEGG